MKRIVPWYLLLVLLGAGMLMHACSQEKNPASDRSVPVMTAAAVMKAVPVQMRAMGTVEAYRAVSVMSQITAQIRKSFFREGQDVRKGDLLIELDCRNVEAALKQAEANLARDRAQAGYAREQAARYADLVERDYVARDQYDQMQANADAAAATVRSDEAAVESARVQLQYCSIHSPIDGRTGMLKVDPGNLAKADDTELLSINQVQPVYVSFPIPEGDLAEVMKHFREGKVGAEALIPSEDRPEKGELVFVDNAIDRTTGTITLRAVFANPDKRLVPGQFVDVVLTLATRPDAVLVPTRAVEQGQEGQYVFVVRDDATVEMRPVKTGQAVGKETIVLEGLRPGEQVVTDGQMRLVPGAKVSIGKAP